ncbi:MAG: type I-C CRISPR-associated endonuclease Cas1c [Bacillota bacterium]
MLFIRKLLNVLYVTSPDSHLARDGENVVVLAGEETKGRFPIHNLEGIVHFGYTGATPGLMALCAERNVGLSFCTETGRFLARVTGPVHGNVLLRRKQYRIADMEQPCVELARAMVVGKIFNSRTVLQRAMRDYSDRMIGSAIPAAVARLAGIVKEAANASALSILRGMEGEAAKVYFEVVDHLILDQKDHFCMKARSRRPPQDRFNALLSFVYMLLVNECSSALETVGLDPAVGFLHRDRPGRASLALDIMEELRPYLADRLALSLVNRKQVTADGFVIRESGAVYMDDATRKTVLQAWQNRKRETITHPYLNEKVPVGLLPYAQALLLARRIRGDIDGYPPFVFR